MPHPEAPSNFNRLRATNDSGLPPITRVIGVSCADPSCASSSGGYSPGVGIVAPALKRGAG